MVCIAPNFKKAMLEILEDKCSIDESEVCSTLVPMIRSWPECGFEKEHRPRKQRVVQQPFVEQTFVQNPAPERPKRRRKLSNYQKHMSVCLLKNEGFDTCIQKWKSGGSMDDEYKGDGYTK
jgi:hypothetical protein